MHRIILSSAVALLLSAATATAESGSAFIQQIASFEIGGSSKAFRQLPSAADIRAAEGALIEGLRSRFGAAGGLEINQTGDFHVASISQDGESGNIATVEQRGAGNSVILRQHGQMNAFVLSQDGAGNSTHGIQSGDANYARISQRSDGNTVRFTQSGAGNMLTVAQD